MKETDSQTYARMLACCGKIHEDDGVPPRYLLDSKPNRRRSGRKLRQLCRQVANTLSQILAGECADEQLRDLCVTDVQPMPDASRLLVSVCPAIGAREFDPEAVSRALDQNASRLRCEVAATITRKRAPQIAFRVTTAEW